MTVFLPFSPSYGFIMLYSVAQYRSYNGLWKPTSAYSHLKYWMISRGSYGTYRGMWRWVRDGEGAERGCSWSAERGNAPVFRPSEVKSCYLVSRHESPTLCSPDHQINLSASFQLHLAVCHTLNTSKHIIQTTFWSNNLCPQSILQPCHPIQKPETATAGDSDPTICWKGQTTTAVTMTLTTPPDEEMLLKIFQILHYLHYHND